MLSALFFFVLFIHCYTSTSFQGDRGQWTGNYTGTQSFINVIFFSSLAHKTYGLLINLNWPFLTNNLIYIKDNFVYHCLWFTPNYHPLSYPLRSHTLCLCDKRNCFYQEKEESKFHCMKDCIISQQAWKITKIPQQIMTSYDKITNEMPSKMFTIG